MPFFAILWPTFALVGLILVVWFSLIVARLGHIKRNPPGAEDFATGSAAMRYFEPVEMPANNLRNLFEMPILYFALVPLLLLTTSVTPAQVGLAWAFVILRALHSLIHIGANNVKRRFFAYLLSVVVLSAMWIGFAVDMCVASADYANAMAHLY
ncbi:MAG TPA: MAPEG family protein [Sphingomicrobium sp.]